MKKSELLFLKLHLTILVVQPIKKYLTSYITKIFLPVMIESCRASKNIENCQYGQLNDANFSVSQIKKIEVKKT